MRVIGLISGTSMDGVDAALVDFPNDDSAGGMKLLAFKTIPYPKRVVNRLHAISIARSSSVDEICHLNFFLGELFAQAAVAVAKASGLPLQGVDLIGSHGQTIHHLPTPAREGRHWVRSTLQIGEPSIIAERTGAPVVADFRPRDMAAGGEGAPLTPYYHHAVFARPDRGRLVVNIGGISNVTWLPPGGGLNHVLAFDTGPGNMMIDAVVRLMTRGRATMDRDGKIAEQGRIDERLLDRLLEHPFIQRDPPKTTGREVFGEVSVRSLLKSRRTTRARQDLVATLTSFTALSIYANIARFIRPIKRIDDVIVGGGGARNPVLMRMIRLAFGSIPVTTFEDHGYDSKAIEAMAFALLARDSYLGRPTNVPSATGAKKKVILGKIIPVAPKRP